MQKEQDLAEQFDMLDEAIQGLEQSARQEQPLNDLLQQGEKLVAQLLSTYAHAHGKPMPATDDLLELFKAFVKGDPSLNTVRDNVRELVYYRNCLDMGRTDALPAKPTLMVAHTARHIYYYLKSRSEQEGQLD